MKLNYLVAITIALIIIFLLLSFLNVFSVNFSEIISYLLILTGIYFVYVETTKQNRLMIFIGSILFLLGTFFIIVKNFNLQTNKRIAIPLILIFSGAGLLIVYITTSAKKTVLIISALLLSAGLSLFMFQSRFGIDSFIKSVLPVLNFLWPVFIILIVLIIIFKIK